MSPTAMDRRTLLQKIEIFGELGERDIDELLEITTTRRLAAREMLCRKGDEGKQLYGVMSGRLRVSAAGEDGREVVFGFMNPGEVIGEIALVDPNRRSADVEAIEPCELLSLHRRDFVPFIDRHPRVALELGRVLAQRVRRLSEVIEDAAFLSLASRLAKKLVSLAESYGKPTEEGLRIELKIPQHELGELVGASRESVNKQLRAWVSDELVLFERGYVTVRDLEGLESISRVLMI